MMRPALTVIAGVILLVLVASSPATAPPLPAPGEDPAPCPTCFAPPPDAEPDPPDDPDPDPEPGSGPADPGGGDSGPTPGPSGPIEIDPGGDTSWDGSFNNSSLSAPGESGSLFGFTPVDAFGTVLEWTATTALSEAAAQIDVLTEIISGMPAPGEPEDPSTWLDPDNGLWPGVWSASNTHALPLAFAILAIAGTWAFHVGDTHRRRQRFLRVGVGLIMVLLTWFVAPLGLHFGATVGAAMAPEGAEFLATPGDFGKLGAGFLLAAVLAFVSSTVIIVALFVLAAQYFLAHAVVFFWPIAWALRAFDGFPKSLGDFVIYLWGALIALNVGQAMLLRLVFELPWELTANPTTSLLGFLGTTAGLAFTLIWFPKEMLDQVSSGSAVGLGVSEGTKAAGAATAAARQRVGDVRSTYQGSGRGDRSRDGAAAGAGRRAQTPRPAATTDGGRSDSDYDFDFDFGESASRSSSSSTPANHTYRDSAWRQRVEQRETDYATRNR